MTTAATSSGHWAGFNEVSFVAGMRLLFWICLRSAGRIVAVIGQGGVEAISRIMGFLLVCMAVQFVINGVLEIVQQYGGV